MAKNGEEKDNVKKGAKEGTGECTKCGKQTQPKMECKCPERQADGSWKETKPAHRRGGLGANDDTKVEHKTIYAALAAFQGENPVLQRTKRVSVKSKKGEESSYEFWYAPLDEILNTVRPLLAKHGLSFVHIEQGEVSSTGNRNMVCVLYHETYEKKKIGDRKVIKSENRGEGQPSSVVETTEPMFEEINVIRSMPLLVKRTGDMKDVGSESTYARRYTLGEVLGIAPEDDNDIADQKERMEKVENFAFKQAKERVSQAKDHKTLTEQVAFFEKEMKVLAEGKVPSLGFEQAQYDELMKLAAERRTALGKPNDIT